MSRSAFDLVVEERDRLRAQNDDLMDHLRRRDRAEAGLRETPVQKPGREPIPEEVMDQINRWESRAVRDRQLEDAHRAYRLLGSWDRVLEHLRAQ